MVFLKISSIGMKLLDLFENIRIVPALLSLDLTFRMILLWIY